MTQAQFNMAMDIIAHHHSTTARINASVSHFIGNIGSTTFTLHITKCVPSLIKDFVQHDYLLEMTADGLRVDKI